MHDALHTTWFDGRSPVGHAVTLVQANGQLTLQGDGIHRTYELSQVRWPEKARYGPRLCDLPDGSSVQHTDNAQWDAWLERQGYRPSWVVASTLSWRRVLASVMGILVITVIAWRWGIPAASEWVAPQIPIRLQQRIGEQALEQIKDLWLMPSQIPSDEQERLRKRFVQMVKTVQTPEEQLKPHLQVPLRLHFFKAPMLRANAFALPGGDVVMTDDMVELLRDEPDALMGVLAHERGHVMHHHGMQMVIKTSLLSALVGAVVGDAGSFLTAIPMVLATQSYSRDAEREADEAAALFLHRNGIHPRVMAVFFERVRQQVQDKSKSSTGKTQDNLPIGLASHPPDAQRIAFFSQWQP